LAWQFPPPQQAAPEAPHVVQVPLPNDVLLWVGLSQPSPALQAV
jgi:hypothetical protein